MVDESVVKKIWQGLLEKDDRTSPAEYPDMALITFDELSDFISRSVPTPPSGEALGEEIRNLARELRTTVGKKYGEPTDPLLRDVCYEKGHEGCVKPEHLEDHDCETDRCWVQRVIDRMYPGRDDTIIRLCNAVLGEGK